MDASTSDGAVAEVARSLMAEIGGTSAMQKLQSRSSMRDFYSNVIKGSQDKVGAGASGCWTREEVGPGGIQWVVPGGGRRW